MNQHLQFEHDDWQEPVPCPDFCNDGIIITCCDDMCAGQDHCIHGDSEAICPTCKGEGELVVQFKEEDDYANGF